MKKESKKDIRSSLNNDIEEYLKNGGEVKNFERGETGLANGRFSEQTLSFEKRQERTPVSDVLNTIDQRRESRKKSNIKQRAAAAPKKKVIYDDFGEPLRVVWEEEPKK